MEFGVIDGHAHIFPPLAGACGFADTATHLLHQQRAMHEHGNQPYRRQRDDAIVTDRPLWSAEDSSEAGRKRVKFRVGRCGRFEWEADGEAQYVQFLPPYMADMSAPAEVIARQMDYAGIATAILQNDHIYGDFGRGLCRGGDALSRPFHRSGPGAGSVGIPGQRDRAAGRPGGAAGHGRVLLHL